MVPLSEAHLRRLLREYVGYYHEDEPISGSPKRRQPVGRPHHIEAISVGEGCCTASYWWDPPPLRVARRGVGPGRA